MGKSTDKARAEGVSIIIPVFNKLETTLKCVEHLRKQNKGSAFELIIVDNASTDNTPDVLSHNNDLVYIRNEENLGLSKPYNSAVRSAGFDILFFMHNDVFIYEDNWIAKIRDFILGKPDVGVVGLYGAKTLRENGAFRGKTIVHALRHNPSIGRPYERVAVVDGLFLALRRSTFRETGGFNEDFPVHFYDKDISLRARKCGYVNYVLNISCEHHSASTRRQIRNDSQIRNRAEKGFIELWKEELPASEESWLDKITCLWKRSVS